MHDSSLFYQNYCGVLYYERSDTRQPTFLLDTRICLFNNSNTRNFSGAIQPLYLFLVRGNLRSKKSENSVT